MTSTTTTAGSDAARFDTDRQAIRDVLADLYTAWAAGDAEAFVADYTEDATVVQPGVYKKDREEIRTTMAAAFAGPLSGSRATDHPSSIRRRLGAFVPVARCPGGLPASARPHRRRGDGTAHRGGPGAQRSRAAPAGGPSAYPAIRLRVRMRPSRGQQ